MGQIASTGWKVYDFVDGSNCVNRRDVNGFVDGSPCVYRMESQRFRRWVKLRLQDGSRRFRRWVKLSLQDGKSTANFSNLTMQTTLKNKYGSYIKANIRAKKTYIKAKVS